MTTNPEFVEVPVVLAYDNSRVVGRFVIEARYAHLLMHPELYAMGAAFTQSGAGPATLESLSIIAIEEMVEKMGFSPPERRKPNTT